MLEAPEKEPRDVHGPDGVQRRGGESDVRHAARPGRGARRACRCASERGEVAAVVGPSGCGKTTLLELICGLQRPTPAPSSSEPAALMPQRDLLLPWLGALDNAGARAARAGRRARRGAPPGGPVARALWPRRVRAHPARRAVRGDAPAGLVPAHAARRQAGARARRAVRRARRDHARTRCRAGSPTCSTTEPRTVVLVTHDVEEAIVLADRVFVFSPRSGPRGRRARGRAAAAPSSHRRARRGAARAVARGARGAGMRRLLRPLPALLLLLALVGAWELYVDLGGADPLVLPPPTRSRTRSTRTGRCCGRTSS